jgi:hypothetical protein
MIGFQITPSKLVVVLGVAFVGAAGCVSRPVCPEFPSETPAKAAGQMAQVGVGSQEGKIAFPITRRRNYRIETSFRTTLEVDPTDGARIVEFSLGGRNALVSITDSPDAHGSSIWSSPQSDWNWPPPPELDRLPWRVQQARDALVLESSVVDSLGLKVVQRIVPEERSKSVRIDYEFANVGTKGRMLAPWQNSRVRPNGVTFYPASRPTYDIPENTLFLAPSNGVSWFRHRPEESKESRKSYADAREGWVAHLDDRLLFIKQFEDVSPENQAPMEGEVLLYVHHSGRFVEIEQQGKYEEIPVGASRFWAVRWYLREVPDSIPVEVGSEALVAFVREQLVALP